MRSILDTFTRWQGRLRRSQFWLAIIVLLVVEFAAITLASQLGFAEKHTSTVVTTLDTGAQQTGYITTWNVSPWATFVISLLLLPLAVIVTKKRRHDRGKSGVDAMLILTAGILLQLLALGGIGGGLVQLFGLAYVVGTVYLLVVAGILPGTPGTNQYGAPQ